jgi:translation elongation factor EF-1alpha
VQLAKTLGVVKLVVVVNKLDDHSVACENGQWDQNRWVVQTSALAATAAVSSICSFC